MEKEALYFLNAFAMDYLDLSFPEDLLIQEFEDLTALVDNAACRQVFLHRDFQSRNIMIRDGEVRIIDFQAGRLGPPGYDVASLLHDPYVDIPWTMRYELYEYYLERSRDFGESGEKTALFKEFSLFSILRLLQALGAYGFLAGRKKRPFFKLFMLPALKSLERPVQLA
jgi:aminoglycoside/choline kinase family phosphotransferase